MKIRPIQEKDNQALHQLIQKILKSYGLDKPGTAYFDPELSQLSYYYQNHENAQYFVLEDEDKLIGGVGIAPFDEDICELQKIYLEKEYRGQGLGEKLLETALYYAKEHYGSIYLETHSSLKGALKLYEKFGFVSLEQPHEKSVHSAMDVWMGKEF